ncbi:MAG: uncharacterized protein JWM74_2825 [Myxococcaceae bacterium]|nr:uncharacterized protein [Myxococcaceae bacterium]
MPDRRTVPPLEDLDEARAFLERISAAVIPPEMADLMHLTWADPVESGSATGEETAGDTEARLRDVERRFKTLIEQIPAVTFMAVLGEGKNEIYVSPHIETMLGFSQTEWLENPFLWYTQLHPEDRDLWHQEFTRGVQTGGPFRAECRFLARDGRVVWVHGEARLVKDEIGRPLFLQGVAFDISESKREQEVMVKDAVQTAKVQEELAIATRVQLSLLPRSLDVEGLEMAGLMRPADEVGGDYYDVLPVEGGAWLAIGDVSGHGLDAGLIMLMLQSAMSGIVYAMPNATPKTVLSHVNHVVYDNVRRRLEASDHVTLSLFRYTPDGKLVFAGAHEEILIYRHASGRVEQVQTPGTWLGAIKDIAPVTVDSTIQLYEGDVMLLYTDGLTEAQNARGEMYEIDRLVFALEAMHEESAAHIAEELVASVYRWMARQKDDISLLVVRYRPPLTGAKEDARPLGDAPKAPGKSPVRAKTKGFQAWTSRGDGKVRAKFVGSGELDEILTIRATLDKAHAIAVAEKIAVEIDLRGVGFMTSSCFRELVTYLSRLGEMPPAERYPVTLVWTPDLPWQKRSVGVLSAFAPDNVVVDPPLA